MKLFEIAKLVRAKNAGPFALTIDIMFDNTASYELVRDSGVLSQAAIAKIYSVPTEMISYYEYDSALSLKISFPRTIPSGSRGDTDIYGGQFHSPLVTLEIPTTAIRATVPE